MYAGMTRNETAGLLALIVLIGAGLGVRHCDRPRHAGGVWMEHSAVAANRSGETVPLSPAGPSAPRPLDLNTASEFALAEALPGIGASKAQAIRAYRDQHGGFRDVRELLNVPGIGERTFQRIAPLICVHAPETADPPPDAAPAAPDDAPAVLSHPAAPEPTPFSAPDGRVNINTASLVELQTLANIGPTRAQAILDYRKQHGPFRRIEDLEKVPGIGPKTLEQNQGRLRVR